MNVYRQEKVMVVISILILIMYCLKIRELFLIN
nr:MAG TPA: hypothetical protein [Bacteriophage sp.]